MVNELYRQSGDVVQLNCRTCGWVVPNLTLYIAINDALNCRARCPQCGYKLQNVSLQNSAEARRRREQKLNRKNGLSYRDFVIARAGGRCQECGARPTEDRSIWIEVDHIVPLFRGGTDTPDNLQVLCCTDLGLGCHQLKHAA